IDKHIQAEKESLPGLVAEIGSLMSNSVKVRFKWRYNRARDRQEAVQSGIEGLEGIVQKLK
ncbi:MAG: hypothetical protein QF886_11300, partial [Planctomycetota bacterium]|nr:hypothetical protein [Planctomycetota bacterium]